MRRYENKVVMVVGCAQGIGRAVAEGYAAEGCKLAMFDILDKVEDAAAAVAGANGIETHCGKIDITEYADCERAVRETTDKFGRIDVLAVVSGILPAEGTVMETPIDQWKRVIDVNLNGYFYIAKAVAPVMVEQKSGNIVMTGSWWGHAGHAYFASYCCSKAGVMKLTHALCEELSAYNIRVNCVCPGSVATEMHLDAISVEAKKRGIDDEEMKKIDYARMAMKRAGHPREIADVFVYLGTDQASYVTGAVIDVNGGGYFR